MDQFRRVNFLNIPRNRDGVRKTNTGSPLETLVREKYFHRLAARALSQILKFSFASFIAALIYWTSLSRESRVPVKCYAVLNRTFFKALSGNTAARRTEDWNIFMKRVQHTNYRRNIKLPTLNPAHIFLRFMQ